MNATEIQELADLLNPEISGAKKIVIVPHKNPDGDALGSSLAMCLLLKAEGHDCVVVSPNSYPDF